ncbi:hypothetical protein MHH52_13585 [Paenibacillus sp. FSL K6-0276]|uniref:hypothetical protein n=1 Tax=Paenibacillus sp. FSL K6-0276 TaxID=2921450 RepID=UPI0030ED1AEE
MLLIFSAKFVFVDGLGAGGVSLRPFYNPDTFTWSNIAQAATYGLLGFIGFDSIASQS